MFPLSKASRWTRAVRRDVWATELLGIIAGASSTRSQSSKCSLGLLYSLLRGGGGSGMESGSQPGP